MKIKTFLIFTAVMLVFAGFGYFRAVEKRNGGSGEGEGFEGPRIVVEPERWDFGEVQRPAVVTHEFIIKNLGGEILEIKRVSTSCGCTTAKIDSEKIEPQQQTKLLVRYDSGAMAHEIGEIERIVYLKTNDAERPQVEIIIKAFVP